MSLKDEFEKETGKSAYVLYCHMAGPTEDFVDWLKGRASKSKETAPSASSNTIKAEIAAIIMHLMNTEWDTSRDEHRVNVAIDEMRQLSAVD